MKIKIKAEHSEMCLGNQMVMAAWRIATHLKKAPSRQDHLDTSVLHQLVMSPWSLGKAKHKQDTDMIISLRKDSMSAWCWR